MISLCRLIRSKLGLGQVAPRKSKKKKKKVYDIIAHQRKLVHEGLHFTIDGNKPYLLILPISNPSI